MRKKCLQVFSIFLIVCLLLTAAPLTGMPELFSPNAANAAAVHSNSDLKYGSDNSITRVEWLHDLTVIFNMTVTDDNMPDNYFSDLEETDSYYYDVMLAVEFGVVDVEAGGEVKPLEKATREFAASTLNFCLGYYFEEDVTYTFSDVADTQYPNDAQIALDRGWVALVDGKFMPALPITSAEIKTMLDDAQTIYNGTEIDTSHEDSIVFKNNVLVIPPETESEIVDENTVTITDCPIALKQGDLFAVYDGDYPVAYHAQSIATNGNITTVTASVAGLSEAYEVYDLEGIMESDEMSVNPTDDVTVEKEAVTTQGSSQKAPKRIQGKKSIMSISKELKFDLGSGASVSGKFKMKNPTLEYRINLDEVYIAVSGSTELSYSVEAKAELVKKEKKFDLCQVGVPLIGGFKVSFVISLSGKAYGTSKGTLTVGLSWKNGDIPRMVKGFQHDYSSITVEAEAKISLKAELGIYENPIVEANLYGEFGIKASAKYISYGDGKKPEKCLEFSAYFYAKVGAKGKIKLLFVEKSVDLYYDIFNKDNSPWRVVQHYDDGVNVAKCGRGKVIGEMSGAGNDYFTPATSRNYGSGWSEASGSRYGYNKKREPIVIFEYELDKDKNATITKYYGNSLAVVIPEKIDGYKVTSIGELSFESNTSLQIVIIPDTVSSILGNAFSDCINLRQVTLPNKLSFLGWMAFMNCDSLTSISIPKSLNEVRSHGPFSECDNLRNISFEKGITTIPAHLFEYCSGIQSIIIPDTVTTINDAAFAYCTNLKQVQLSNNLTVIGDSAFKSCSSLETIEFPSSLLEIQGEAFCDCSMVKSIELPDRLSLLGWKAFRNCDALESVFIPKSLKEVRSQGPFSECDNLRNVSFEKGITTIPAHLFEYCSGIQSIIIPDTVTTINDAAFAYCTNLKQVQLSNNLTVIGDSAFKSCSSLETIEFPSSLLEIQGEAFCDCSMVKSIELPDRLSLLGWMAFMNCDALESVFIPKSLKEVRSQGPFSECDNLRNVSFEKGITTIPAHLFEYCSGLQNINIPNTVTIIEESVFSYCDNLEQITLSSALTEIGDNAFIACTSLLAIDVPNSVKTIGNCAFTNCASLTHISFPDSFTNLSCNLNGCKSLTDVHLPTSLVGIPDYFFSNCTSLKELNIPDTVTVIGNGAFYGCSSLSEISIPDSVFSIGSSAFEKCTSLKKAVIPTSVKTIGVSLFSGDGFLTNVSFADYSITMLSSNLMMDCSELQKIVLPKGLVEIANSVFMNDYSLTEITIPASVTKIASDAFSYPRQTTVYGVKGTYAEKYANEKGMNFVDITVPATKIALADNAKELTVKNTESVRAAFALTPNNSTDVITLTCDNSKVKIQGMDIKCASVGDYEITATTTSGLSYSFTLHVSDNHVHNYGAWMKLNDTQHYRVCTDNSSHVEKENHKWDAGKETKAATCTSTGVKTYTCTVCSATKTETIGKTAHKLTKTEAKAASCIAAGNVEYYTCSVCKKTFSDAKGTKEIKEVTTAATGHNYGAWTKLNDNQHQRICANDKTHVEKADHTWDGGMVTKKATTEAAGEKTFTCTICSATKTEQIDKLVPEEIKDKATNISVSFTTGAFSAEVVLKVQEIKETSQLLDEQYGSVTAFDISTLVGNKKVQPKSSVTVKIPVPKGYKVDAIAVYHIADNGQKEQIQIKIENGFIIFTANRFSIYAVVDTSTIVSVTLGDVDGDGNISAADARLALRRSVGLETYEEGSPEFFACDVDLDGNVSAADARLILRASVGLEDPKTWVK